MLVQAPSFKPEQEEQIMCDNTMPAGSLLLSNMCRSDLRNNNLLVSIGQPVQAVLAMISRYCIGTVLLKLIIIDECNSGLKVVILNHFFVSLSSVVTSHRGCSQEMIVVGDRW